MVSNPRDCIGASSSTATNLLLSLFVLVSYTLCHQTERPLTSNQKIEAKGFTALHTVLPDGQGPEAVSAQLNLNECEPLWPGRGWAACSWLRLAAIP
ncbi:hypothetical protein F4679DRAFT_224088 [Xylaria curta]|nr:hypothetical protein F4679DRAFT_224088 [Xylaria curta]